MGDQVRTDFQAGVAGQIQTLLASKGMEPPYPCIIGDFRCVGTGQFQMSYDGNCGPKNWQTMTLWWLLNFALEQENLPLLQWTSRHVPAWGIIMANDAWRIVYKKRYGQTLFSFSAGEL